MSQHKRKAIRRRKESIGQRSATARRVAPATMAAAIGLASAASAHAATLAICDQSYDPYKASQATLQACGNQQLPATITRNADGSTLYEYTMPGGGTIKSLLPPPDFNAATASAADLAKYGIPAEPPVTDAVAHEWWQKMVDNLHFVTPPAVLITGTAQHQYVNYTPPMYGQAVSGYRELAPSGSTENSASGIYTQPTVGTSCANAGAALWTGLGGGHGNYSLAQDGTNVQWPGGSAGQAWYEIPPGNAVYEPLYAAPQDQFKNSVSYVSPNQVHFYQYDYTTGLANPPATVSWSNVDLSSAEFEMERPTSPNKPLLDIGTSVYWSLAYANGRALGSTGWPVEPDYMMSDDGTHSLANTGYLQGSNSAFENYKNNCQ